MGKLIFLLTFSLSLSVSATRTPNYKIIHHSFFEITSPIDSLLQTGMSLGINGRDTLVPDRQCREDIVEDIFLNSDNLTGDVKKVETILNQCHSKLYSGTANQYLDLVLETNTSYRYEETGRFVGLRFRDTYGRVMEGHLGLKNTSEPLPLVIFKCGVTCNLDSKTTRKALMQFFDEGPFHVLAIPNMTGSVFVNNNKQMGYGGFDEGRFLIEVARYVRSPEFPYSKNFSTAHIVAISLGGLSLFYSALYQDAQILEGTKPVINSFVAACPVVDMERSLRQVFVNPLARFVFGKTIVEHARYTIDAQSPIKIIEDWFTSPFSRGDLVDFFGQAYSEVWQLYMRDIVWGSSPLKNVRINKTEDFWHYNQFQNYAHHITTPTLVWAPADDPIVQRESNASLLEKIVTEKNLPAFKFLNTEAGNHCAFITNFGWGMSGTVIRSFILKHSPEILKQRKVEFRQTDFLSSKFRTLPKGYERKAMYFRAEKNLPFILVDLKLLKIPCPISDRGPMHCASSRTEKIPFHKLGLVTKDIPATRAEAESLTRWLNTSMQFINDLGEPISKQDEVDGIRITSYGPNRLMPH